MERCAVWRVLLGLWVLGTTLWRSRGAPTHVYEVHVEKVMFDKAVEVCSREGRLAELSTVQEVSEVLRHAAALLEGSFWVGLRKTKSKCVVPHLPLQGFTWVSDGSEHWEGGLLGGEAGPWWKKPEPTCTTSRCASLSVQDPASEPPRWGLLQGECKINFSFICQRTLVGGPSPGAATTQIPTSITTQTPPSITTRTPPSITTPTLPVTSRTSKPPPGAQAPGGLGTTGDPVPKTRSCPNPSIPRSRWLMREPESGSLLVVACWSGDKWWLNCSDGRWELDGAVVLDPAGVCDGNQTGVPSPTPTLDSGWLPGDIWAGPLVPVLVAVAVLVVLVVLALVAVRCCRARRSKYRAVRRAEKMELKNAGGKDSMDNSSKA